MGIAYPIDIIEILHVPASPMLHLIDIIQISALLERSSASQCVRLCPYVPDCVCMCLTDQGNSQFPHFKKTLCCSDILCWIEKAPVLQWFPAYRGSQGTPRGARMRDVTAAQGLLALDSSEVTARVQRCAAPVQCRIAFYDRVSGRERLDRARPGGVTHSGTLRHTM